MKPWLNLTGGIAALALSASSFGQVGIFVPPSNRYQSSDAGRFAHTNYLVNLEPAGFQAQPLLAETYGPRMFAPGGISPQMLRTAYSLPSSGGGRSLAIIIAYHYATAQNDFNVFSLQYGLPQETSASITASSNLHYQVVYASGVQPAVNTSWNQEAALDTEWSHAMAPSAKIYLVEAASNSLADLMQAVDVAATLPGVSEISMSWATGEFSTEPTYDSHFRAGGVVYFAASGDTGGMPVYPAMSNRVVSCGGESLHLTSTGLVTSESGWSGSGGGTSLYENKPTWQNGIALLPGSKRGGPDVSAVADPATGVAVYDSTPSSGFSGWLVFGGTSVATPVLAGIANVTGKFHWETSYTDIQLYTGQFIQDITTGSAGIFHCGPGWDFVTGMGRPLGVGAL